MVEELFKKYYPEYVTEKGECLSPYWDLFSTGIECATDELNKGCIQTLTKENAELKEKLEHRNCVDCSNHGGNIKLHKAKEIIKELHAIVVLGKVNFVGIDVPAFKKKAEQFLKECEK